MKLIDAPDERWLPFFKLIFGFMLLVIFAILALAIALGEVHQDSSFGLSYILGGLTSMTGGFVQWAFSAASDIVVKKEDKSDS